MGHMGHIEGIYGPGGRAYGLYRGRIGHMGPYGLEGPNRGQKGGHFGPHFEPLFDPFLGHLSEAHRVFGVKKGPKKGAHFGPLF